MPTLSSTALLDFHRQMSRVPQEKTVREDHNLWRERQDEQNEGQRNVLTVACLVLRATADAKLITTEFAGQVIALII